MPKEAQDNLSQYKMPNALKKQRDSSYQVGYTATTGNQTGGEAEVGKRADYKN